MPQQKNVANNGTVSHLLDDDPSHEDYFGSHSRVAKAIATLVKTEQGRKSIALTGPWGSGKSTTLKLLKKELQQPGEPEAKVFVFDSWAHQGDPLRLAFLDELDLFLKTQKWEGCHNWGQDLHDLRIIKHKSASTSKPILKFPAKALAFAALFLPIAYALISKYGLDQYDKNANLVISSNWKGDEVVLWSLYLAFGIPALIVIWTLVYTYMLKPIYYVIVLDLILNKPVDYAGKFDVFSNLIQHEENVGTEVYMRSPNPSTIEFRNIFHQIVCEVLRSPERRLVVALDNLDRMSTEEAIDLWSTLRVFFQPEIPNHDDPESKSKESALSRLWLIVPFSFPGVIRLWEQGSQQYAVSSESSFSNFSDDRAAPAISRSPAETMNAVDGFLNKTFQVTFCVSPPLTSDWYGYFLEKLKQAFDTTAIAEGEFHAVYSIYHHAMLAKQHSPDAKIKDRFILSQIPTPREIKLFVNKLYSFHIMCGEEISLRVMATYLIHQELITNDFSTLFDIGLLDQFVISLLDGVEWQQCLAAIHFNVPLDKALEVSLTPIIEKALSDTEAGKIKDLSGIPGFWPTLARIIARYMERPVTVEPVWPFYVFSELTQMDQREHLFFESLLDSSLKRVQTMKAFPYVDRKLGDAIAGFIRGINKDKPSEFDCFAQKILELSSGVKVNFATPDGELGRQWLEGTITIMESIIDLNGSQLIKDHYQVDLAPPNYANLLRLLTERPWSEVFVYFSPIGPNSSPEQIVQVVSSYANSSDQVVDVLTKVIGVMIKMSCNWPWESLVGPISHWLTGTASPNLETVYNATYALLQLSLQADDDTAKQALRDLGAKGNFTTLLKWGILKNHRAAISLSLFAVLEAGLSYDHARRAFPQSPLWKQYTDLIADADRYNEIVEAFAEHVVLFQRQEQLNSYARDKTSREFLDAVIDRIGRTA